DAASRSVLIGSKSCEGGLDLESLKRRSLANAASVVSRCIGTYTLLNMYRQLGDRPPFDPNGPVSQCVWAGIFLVAIGFGVLLIPFIKFGSGTYSVSTAQSACNLLGTLDQNDCTAVAVGFFGALVAMLGG